MPTLLYSEEKKKTAQSHVGALKQLVAHISANLDAKAKNRDAWITKHIWEVRLCVVQITLLHIYFYQAKTCICINVQNLICRTFR